MSIWTLGREENSKKKILNSYHLHLLTSKLLHDIQLGNDIKLKYTNIYMTYRKKGLLQLGTRKYQLTWAMAFF